MRNQVSGAQRTGTLSATFDAGSNIDFNEVFTPDINGGTAGVQLAAVFSGATAAIEVQNNDPDDYDVSITFHLLKL